MKWFQQKKVNAFHNIYYNSRIWEDTHWLGVPALKNPLDMWIYQEILFDLRPDRIVECGTYNGGSAFYLASICDLLGNGQIMTIDIEHRERRPVHPRITYCLGSSTSLEVIQQVKDWCEGSEVVMVILDSDHSQKHVYEELLAYSSLVSLKSYLIVEDSNINGHPVLPIFGPGPMEAIDQFMRHNNDFEIDSSREKFLFTFNPKGYLRRIR